jgi:hypothetical protein
MNNSHDTPGSAVANTDTASSRPIGPSSSPIAPGGGDGGSRWWIGCLAGCGCLFLLAIGLIAGLVFWSVVPGEQVPSQGIVGEESIGSARVERIAEDEGVSEFLLAALIEWIEAARRVQQEQMPEELQWLTYLQGSAEGELKDLKKVLPRDATLILEPPVLLDDGQIDRVPWVAAINVNRYPRLIRFFTRRFLGVIDDPGHERIRHRGVVIDSFEDGFAAGFLDSTLLVADEAGDVVAAVDRLLDGTGGVSVAQRLGALSSDLGEWDFESAVLNQDGVFDDWISGAFFRERSPRKLFEDQGADAGIDSGELSFEPQFEPLSLPSGGVDRVTLRFDVETRDTARARLDFSLEPGSDVEGWRNALERSSRDWFEDARQRGLDVQIVIAQPADSSIRDSAEGLVAEFEVSGLIAVMKSWVESTLLIEDRDDR